MRRLVMSAALVLAVSACSAENAAAPAESASPDSGSPTKEIYSLVGGSTVDLAAVRANKPIALWFWAPG